MNKIIKARRLERPSKKAGKNQPRRLEKIKHESWKDQARRLEKPSKKA